MRRSLATQCMFTRWKVVLHAKCATCALTMQFRGQCCSGGHSLFLWTVAPSTVQTLHPHTASSDTTATGAFQQLQPASFGRPAIACHCCSQHYEHYLHLCAQGPMSSMVMALATVAKAGVNFLSLILITSTPIAAATLETGHHLGSSSGL